MINCKRITILSLFLAFMFLSAGYAQDIKYFKQKSYEAFQEMEKEFQKQEDEEILLKACAYGQTTKEARISALKGLSQQIISEVQAREELYRKREQGRIYRKYVSSSEIFTKSLLKGVEFKSFDKTPAGYKVCAYFTRSSLNKTIGYLKSVLDVNLSKLNREQLKDALTKAEFLLNIAFLSHRSNEIVKFAQKKIEQINTYLNYGCLIVNVVPSDARVNINGKIYSSGEPIYLPPERTYIVKIESSGYEPITKNVYLGRGEKKSITVELVKKVKTDVKLYVFSNVEFIIDEASVILSQAGFKITSSPVASNAVYLKLKDATVKVDEYTRHTLYMYAIAYKEKEKFLEVRGRTKEFFTTSETEVALIKKKADKLLRAVLKRLVNELNIREFKGNEKVNYLELFGQPTFSKSEKVGRQESQAAKAPALNLGTLKGFINWLVKSYKIRDFGYDILKPDSSGEFYTSVLTSKRYDKEVEEGKEDKYLLFINFKLGYSREILFAFRKYFAKFSKNIYENVGTSDVYKHRYTVFVGIYSTLKNSNIWNVGFRLTKSDFKKFRKYLKEMKSRKGLKVIFKDYTGITVFGLKYRFYGCGYGWERKCIFVLEDTPRGWITKRFRVPWIWEEGKNVFVLIEAWEDIALKGFIPESVGKQVRKVEYKF